MNSDKSNLGRNYTIEDLEELLDNIPYEVYIKNIDGMYKYANKATLERIGLKKEDVIGKNDYDIRSYEMAKICSDGDKAVVKNGYKTFIEDKVRVGNIETSYELFKTLLYNNENETLIGGVAKFVSEDKSLCKSIKENSNDIMNKSEKLNDSIVYNNILNALKNTINSDDVALYFYDNVKGKMNLNNHLGKNNFIFEEEYSITDENKEVYYNNYDCEIKENLKDNSIKYIYLLKNNNILLGCIHIYYKNKPFTIKEEFIRYICIVLSFTKANKILTDNMNKELKIKNETQKKLQMIIDSMVDIYVILRKEGKELRYIEMNKKCKEIMGWDVEDLNSRNYLEFIHPKDRESVRYGVDEENKEVVDRTFTMKCKDGKEIIIDASLNHLAEDIYMITAKDVTTLTELKKDKEHLKQVVELESLKTEFFANLSHEFKTPLNIILSTVQLIMNYIEIHNQYPSSENFNRYIRNIKQNSYRLLKLANNMIDITKIDGNAYQMNMGNFNIVEIIENIVQSLVVYMKNNKRNIIFDTMEEEIIMACDPEKIERIILNLLSNAMKFTSSEGNIYVNMEVNDECSKVIIKVGNDGVPISIEDSKKIFGRFTQSENLLTRSIEGSGIGLSLVKSLVELHNGIIYVNTEVTEGTEFCIELPIRKIMNSPNTDVREKSITSKVEKFDIEFSDIYD